MARTLTSTITLSSTTTGSDALSFSATANLNIDLPIKNIGRVALNASGGSDTTLLTTPSAAITYLYVKNMGLKTDGITATTDVAVLETGGTAFAEVPAGEWTLIPVVNGRSIDAVSGGSHTVIIEYGHWAKV
tara:strand:+ start:434 stop:829 length:396 start_codon:yes stop_codon:yes gene_type:complete